MKRFFLICLFAISLLRSTAFGQPAFSYINTGNVSTPQNIDALNFLNLGNLDFSLADSVIDFSDVINFTNKNSMISLLGWIFDTQPSDSTPEHPASVFVNTAAGVITASSPTTRTLDVHGVPLQSPQLIGPEIKVIADHSTNQGTLHAGPGGLIGIAGQDVNLRNGSLQVDGVSSTTTASPIIVINPDGTFGTINGYYPGLYLGGIFDTYWGVGTDTNQSLLFDLPFLADSGEFNETNASLSGLQGVVLIQNFLQVFNPTVYAFQNVVGGNISNVVTQIVLIGNGNLDTNTVMDVRFADSGELTGRPSDFQVPIVQWLSFPPTIPGQQPVTNSLYLTDDFGTRTNGRNIVRTNSQSLSGRPGYAPTNYLFSRTYPLITPFNFLPTANDGGILNLLTNGFGLGDTNAYAAYGVSLLAATATPDPAHPLANVTNTPGRIEIDAGNLDLTRARLQGANYIRIAASNEFFGSIGSQISAPTMDINLTRTNGDFVVTNLVAPYLPQWSGTIDMYSCRFTNVFGGSSNVVNGVTNIIGNITNRYHILMIESALSSIASASVQSLAIKATNTSGPNLPGQVFISDVLNITSNLLVVGDRVTITTNLPGSATPTGEINLSSDIDWTTSFPNLNYLTNNGQITFPGLGSFYGQRQPPYYPTFMTESYQSMANHGTISASGIDIRANYFENIGTAPVTNNEITFPTNIVILTNTILLPVTGLVLPTIGVQGAISAYAGPILLQAQTAILEDGEFTSQTSDIDLTANFLTVSNHALIAGGALNLMVGNQFNPSADGSGRLITNFWQVNQGFNLPFLPTGGQPGDLMGTTLTSIVQPYQEVVSTWAGLDFGPVPFGFTNNVAVGHLVLDGLHPTSQFTFSAATAGNALYVDLLDLRDYATNRVNPDLTELSIDPDGIASGVTNMVIYFADAQIVNADGTVTDISEKLNHANNDRLRWVRSFNDGLFSSTNFAYPSGQIYQFNRPLVQSTAIDSDGDGTPNAYDATPFGAGAPTVQFAPFLLTVQMANQPAHTALISWPTTKGATNHLEFKSRLTDSGWMSAVVTNSPVTGVVTVSLQTTNSANYYRVRIEPQQ